MNSCFSHRLMRAIAASAASICFSMFAVTATAQTTRSYQMSVLASTGSNAGVDIPMFTRGVFRYDVQPPGRSIVWLPPEADLDIADSNDYDEIDWSRIVAVYVDEPYGEILKNNNIFCAGTDYQARKVAVAALAADARRKAPSARFWVNFTPHEIDLLLGQNLGCDFNQSYIDVISMDIYGVNFNTSVSDRYNNLYANRRATPYQQLALIAGTYTNGGDQQTATQAISRLSEYRAYAQAMNQQCTLPLGPTRITGIYDRCPVWMLIGWPGGPDIVNPGSYYPIDHANSTAVLDAWQTAFAVPKVDPSKVRATRALVPLLRND